MIYAINYKGFEEINELISTSYQRDGHVNGIKTWPIDDLISIPNDPDLISQLSQPLRFINEAGKIQIESKKDLKKRGIKSPDDAESLILAYGYYGFH